MLPDRASGGPIGSSTAVVCPYASLSWRGDGQSQVLVPPAKESRKLVSDPGHGWRACSTRHDRAAPPATSS